MKKRMLALSLAVVLGLGALAGCGSKTSTQSQGNEIVVGASIEPHATILNSDAFKNKLEELGYTVKVVEYTDYVQPNVATNDGSLDANFFQHTPFMEDFNKNNKGSLVSVVKTHFEPLGIYAGKTTSLADVTDGAVVAVPNDSTNEARALKLLEEQGFITITEGKGLNATTKDIVENPFNLTFQEIESAQTSKVLKDVDLAVINGNYALEAGLSVEKDALAKEEADSLAADEYANIVAVKKGNEDSEKTKALVEAITCDEVKAFIEETWNGAVVPVF